MMRLQLLRELDSRSEHRVEYSKMKSGIFIIESLANNVNAQLFLKPLYVTKAEPRSQVFYSC